MNPRTQASLYQDPFFKSLFTTLGNDCAGDTYFSHHPSTIDEIKQLQYNEVQARHTQAGIEFDQLNEVRQRMMVKLPTKERMLAGDEFFNPYTNLGTANDPQMFTRSTVPVMFGPTEASGTYASGGLASTIIDKKARGMVGDGVTFKTLDNDFWDPDRIKMLEEAAELTQLNEHLTDQIRDALIFGGAELHPIFKGDNVNRMERDMEALRLEPGCIERWVQTDRWNIVYVPSYIVTAEDYLLPKTIYIPLGGYAVSTSRCCLMRPKSQPYWALLYNIGWSPADYCGFIRPLLAYTMVTMAVPIMAQQMSLLFYQMPLDALQAGLGVQTVKEMMQINEEKIREASILNPKAVNMVGELKVIERTFAGFEHFVESAKSDLAAQCGIAQPILFHTPNKGFSDNTQQALLKESEMMKMLQRQIEVQLTNLTDALIAHTWGQESEEWEMRKKIHMSFDKPMTSSEKDTAEIGARYAATIASLTTGGVPVTSALAIAGQFFRGVQISKEDQKKIEEYEEWNKKLEEEGLKQKQEGGGAGHSLASKGNAGNTGAFTHPKKS